MVLKTLWVYTLKHPGTGWMTSCFSHRCGGSHQCSTCEIIPKIFNRRCCPTTMVSSFSYRDPQKGAKNIPENYRSVSITSIVGKLMESIVRDNLVAHMSKNNLISEKQHGFVPKKNCMTNLLICLEKWTKLLNNGFLLMRIESHIKDY